jgi:sporulation-control protein spo0M
MFGFGKGKIDIAIQKTNYAPGATVSGNVALTLKKPVQAREVSISLIGTAWVTTYSGTTTSSGVGITGGEGITLGTRKSSSSWKEHKRIYDFKQQLDREKEYTGAREYHFEIRIPADILSLGTQTTGRIKWCLLAKLDIPRGLDIKKKVDITIG